jgi:hypothetical protein
MQTGRTGHKILNVTTQTGKELKLVVKRHLNRNEYLQVENYWVRNFNASDVTPVDINNFFDEFETTKILNNEIQNTKFSFQLITQDMTQIENLIVISDGYGFRQHDQLKNLKSNVGILVLNHAMRFWESPVFPTFMLMNNSTEQAMSCMPLESMPQLITSRRTWSPFLRKYENNIYTYDPTPDENYQSIASKDSSVFLDEYRNPVCAAISFANFLKIKNLFLAFCSYAYSENRPGTNKVDENAYQYPQQTLADRLIDANLFWYKFGAKNRQIFHTGLENSYLFSRYLKFEDFIKVVE